MKNLIISILIFLGFAFNARSQQNYITRIYLKNNDIIKGHLIDYPSSDSILIKSISLDTLLISYSDISMLHFLDSKHADEFKDYRKNQKKLLHLKKKENPDLRYQSVFFKDINIGLGVGVNYGGAGVRIQQKFGNKIGFAWHIGAGYNNYRIERHSYTSYDIYYDYYEAILLNIGVKFVLNNWFYIGSSLMTYPPESLEINGELFFMLGVDYYFSKKWGFDVGFGACAHDRRDYWIYGSRFSFNAGVFYKLFHPYKKQKP